MLQKRLHLWEDGEYDYPCSFGFHPNLVSYLHEDETPRACMIVVPGGGYRFVSPAEGEPVAKKFFDCGYQTFVCTYTVNPTDAVPLLEQPARDLARAIRFIRKHAGFFHVIPDRIVLCGFSAGGHVCGSLCVHHEDLKEDNPEFAGISARPDAGILCYPVITTGKYAHRDSFQALLGKRASKEDLRYWSLELQVTKDTPPCFLWQTATDETVPVENSCLMAKALKENGVPFAHHVFSQGCHGLSLADADYAAGKDGKPYPLEQIFGMLKALKDGTLSCPEEEKKRLLAAYDFFDPDRKDPAPPRKEYKEAEIWPDLADTWIGTVFQER